MIVVTGAAGFIGSCVVARLNELGREDLILVDHYDGADDPKKVNLQGKKYREYYDKAEFLELVKSDKINSAVTCVLHLGACSSTILQDEKYFQQNNFEYSQIMARWALKHNVRFIYASSAATYGDGSQGYSDKDTSTLKCYPLNLYGHSKQKFDLLVLENGWQDRMVGLKFFNVFGPNEYHKGEMRSVIAKAYGRVVKEGFVELFKSYKDGYAHGDQKRDFIYVKDVVRVIMFFVEHTTINGIFNVGTGQARSWNDLARSLFQVVGKPVDIRYIEMPDVLREQYQYFTQADMSKLRAAGYRQNFLSLEDAIKDYAQYLDGQRCW